MDMRTRAQRHWARKGVYWEMIPLKPLHKGKSRTSYVLGSHESWRRNRDFGKLIGMPVRPICKQFIHNGRKP